MLSDKQVQKAGAESTAIQAGGNVSINQYFVSATEVKKLVLEVFRDNYPKLRQEAIKAAELNVTNLSESLESKISEKWKEISLDKFVTLSSTALIASWRSLG